MLPARIRKGAATGIWKVRYCESWSRCRSDRIWKRVFGGLNRPDMRRILRPRHFALLRGQRSTTIIWNPPFEVENGEGDTGALGVRIHLVA